MGKQGLIFTILAAMVLMVGCATVPRAPLQTQRTSAVIPAPKDKVWPLLVAEVGLNYPVQVIENNSGLITTQFVQTERGGRSLKI